jgi:DNA (cytosine-5)-methyltransferase 1
MHDSCVSGSVACRCCVYEPDPKPRLLDAYCCAGGASMGYHRAGFEVEGVELFPRDDYPFKLHAGDAVTFIRDTIGDYDAYAGSPPCQAHTSLTKGNRGRGWTDTHVDLIAATREAFIATGKPYVIENVVGARAELRDPVMLCGLSFGLRVFRHRLFESNVELTVPEHQSHKGHRVAGWRHGVKHEGDMFAVYGDGGGKGTTPQWQAAMGIDWTEDRVCLAEAIPPAYTEHLGLQLLAHVTQEVAA